MSLAVPATARDSIRLEERDSSYRAPRAIFRCCCLVGASMTLIRSSSKSSVGSSSSNRLFRKSLRPFTMRRCSSGSTTITRFSSRIGVTPYRASPVRGFLSCCGVCSRRCLLKTCSILSCMVLAISRISSSAVLSALASWLA